MNVFKLEEACSIDNCLKKTEFLNDLNKLSQYENLPLCILEKILKMQSFLIRDLIVITKAKIM
jgi:hypothetical protein